MKLVRGTIRRLSGASSGWRRDSDLAEELQLHIDMQTEDPPSRLRSSDSS